jgi:hypothetical protein
MCFGYSERFTRVRFYLHYLLSCCSSRLRLDVPDVFQDVNEATDPGLPVAFTSKRVGSTAFPSPINQSTPMVATVALPVPFAPPGQPIPVRATESASASAMARRKRYLHKQRYLCGIHYFGLSYSQFTFCLSVCLCLSYSPLFINLLFILLFFRDTGQASSEFICKSR